MYKRQLRTQSEKIRERVQLFGGKLYMEFGGKLFDDYHASRVLPGFLPDSKVKMLLQMKDQAEIVIVISAGDIEKNKVRGDLGITYDVDVLRLIDAFRGIGLYVGSVVLTQYNAQPAAEAFQKRLESLGVKVFRHYTIPGYPSNIPLIVSDEGFGKNEYVETSRSPVSYTHLDVYKRQGQVGQEVAQVAKLNLDVVLVPQQVVDLNARQAHV